MNEYKQIIKIFIKSVYSILVLFNTMGSSYIRNNYHHVIATTGEESHRHDVTGSYGDVSEIFKMIFPFYSQD